VSKEAKTPVVINESALEGYVESITDDAERELLKNAIRFIRALMTLGGTPTAAVNAWSNRYRAVMTRTVTQADEAE
jgi:hypothetical protein